MEDLTGLITVICLFVVLPGMAMFFRDRKRRWEAEQQRDLNIATGDLIEIAEKLERRVDALESILDAEAPGWRKRHYE